MFVHFQTEKAPKLEGVQNSRKNSDSKQNKTKTIVVTLENCPLSGHFTCYCILNLIAIVLQHRLVPFCCTYLYFFQLLIRDFYK